MTLLISYWQVIVAVLILIVVAGVGVYFFLKQPRKNQIEQVKKWLAYAVTKVESELGDGTGQLKLLAVYNLFLTKFKWLSFIMTFEMFSLLVDEALDEMRKMLEKNKDIEAIVKNKEIVLAPMKEVKINE